jgi:glycosyltransferase involved in cell wall biosynthesis
MQTFRNFEWVVVDDGSEDETSRLVDHWRQQGNIAIQYRHQANAGKHVAVNRGVEIARGRYTTIVDSDDWLLPESLELLVDHWQRIPEAEREQFSGVVGLFAYEDGAIVGDQFPTDPLDCDQAEIAYEYRVAGDKQSLLRTQVLREFPFPFEACRGLVVEAIVWNRMALKYQERHVNDVVAIKEYRDAGLSDRALELQVRAAPATRQFYAEEMRLPHALGLSRRLRSYANYVRFSFHASVGLTEQARAARARSLWVCALPAGYVAYRRDVARLRDV